MYRLEVDIEKETLLQHTTHNKWMHCHKLKLKHATLHIFLMSQSAMCFVRKCRVLPHVAEYGLVIKSSRLVTSVYTCKLLSKIINMNTFCTLCRKNLKDVTYEPELFPCLTMKCFDVTLRVFHSGSVIFLGVKDELQVVKAYKFLSDLYFDYCVGCNFDNI